MTQDLTNQDLAVKIDKLTDLVDSLAVMTKNGFDNVNVRFEQVDKRFEQTESQLTDMNKTMHQLHGESIGEIGLLHREIADIRKRLERMDKRNDEELLAFADDVDKLTKRVNLLEKRLNRLESA